MANQLEEIKELLGTKIEIVGILEILKKEGLAINTLEDDYKEEINVLKENVINTVKKYFKEETVKISKNIDLSAAFKITKDIVINRPNIDGSEPNLTKQKIRAAFYDAFSDEEYATEKLTKIINTVKNQTDKNKTKTKTKTKT